MASSAERVMFLEKKTCSASNYLLTLHLRDRRHFLWSALYLPHKHEVDLGVRGSVFPKILKCSFDTRISCATTALQSKIQPISCSKPTLHQRSSGQALASWLAVLSHSSRAYDLSARTRQQHKPLKELNSGTLSINK